jgi:Flp pilus assembly protein TadD
VQIGQFESAIRDYTRALEVLPNNGYAYYNRGITLDRQASPHSDARAAYVSAILRKRT